ncbi:cytochrome c biogenesis CcdA family protein [Corynebacterium lactis]|uniref:Cytochrome C biogenesis protein ResC n=1 Tax=Corynebacterium lactis RW2-5 TaxID=1408189 RepID=A0A0K2GXU5_9CORY|nr:cytochrome c biogenesis CcdA family protein [Corynebacterium lactis]ALA66619.1 cytochrome C biogenesis protein ResC [Corynebacterium lactis RW2-5]
MTDLPSTTLLASDIGQQFADAATSGPIILGLLAAALAGLVSFASPCVIPLVPGYVSYLTGISGAAQEPGLPTGATSPAAGGVGKRRGDNARVGLAAFLFVVGFTVIFVLGSASIFGLVSTLRVQARTLTIVGGVVTIVMGLAFMGLVPALQKDTRMAPKRWTTWLGAPLLGAVFALGWTPCLGPTLTAIISVSAGTQGMTAARGVALIIAYCLGLGLPFILVAFGSARAVRGVDFLRRHSRTIQIIGGVLLVAVGVALVTGLWDMFVAWVQAAFITDTVTPI